MCVNLEKDRIKATDKVSIKKHLSVGMYYTPYVDFDLKSLPSKKFVVDDTYTFKQLLVDATKFWKISAGAVESKSVLLVNREGEEWDLTFEKSRNSDVQWIRHCASCFQEPR